MSNNVFSVESVSAMNTITVCGNVIRVEGAVKQADLTKAAKDHNIRNFVVKDAEGNDIYTDDLPFNGSVKIIEYNAAKINGVFTVE